MSNGIREFASWKKSNILEDKSLRWTRAAKLFVKPPEIEELKIIDAFILKTLNVQNRTSGLLRTLSKTITFVRNRAW